MPGEDQDLELLLAWRGGDEGAGSRLLRRQFRSLSRFFHNKVASDQLPDLIQLTMLGAVQSRDRIPTDLAFRIYLMGIARRVLVKHIREQQRSRRDADETHELDSETSPTLALQVQAEQALLLRALRRLPIDLQMVLELHYWEELATDEIAAVLDIPRGTVKSRMGRAREAIREVLPGLSEDRALRDSTIDNLDRWATDLRLVLDREGPQQKEIVPK
jgi:RNA polymerase sigma factor (sigma-70 family)